MQLMQFNKVETLPLACTLIEYIRVQMCVVLMVGVRKLLWRLQQNLAPFLCSFCFPGEGHLPMLETGLIETLKALSQDAEV
jgi:hypothetical protein